MTSSCAIGTTLPQVKSQHSINGKRIIYRPCLAMDQTGPNLKSQKILLEINPNILIFYITSITFYYYPNKKKKKNHYKTKNFTFLCKIFFFSHINQICYSIGPLPQVLPLPNIAYVFYIYAYIMKIVQNSYFYISVLHVHPIWTTLMI